MRRKGIVLPNSQKMRLIAEVAALCERLGCPICSLDLKAHFQKYPDHQPCLLQTLGQQLFKAARPRPAPISVLHRIGVIGKYAYYAATPDAKWAAALERYEVEQRIRREVNLRFVDHVLRLIGTPYEAAARNALAGFVLEWEPIVADPRFASAKGIATLTEAIADAKKYASARFVKRVPKLIDRRRALAVLKSEARKRLGKLRARHINYNRYLARWRWPQSSLFAKPRRLLYSPAQLRLLAQSLWPVSGEDTDQAKDALICLKYE